MRDTCPDYRLRPLSVCGLPSDIMTAILCATCAIRRAAATPDAVRKTTFPAPFTSLSPLLEEATGKTIKLDKLSHPSRMLSEESRLLSMLWGTL